VLGEYRKCLRSACRGKVRVIPNEADTSPSTHPCGDSSDFRLLAIVSEPTSIAP